MAKQYRVLRKVASVPIQAGSFATLDLPRDYDYESIFLRINGSVQVTGAATSVRNEAPTQLVQRVEVIADGKNNIFSAPFWFASNAQFNGRDLLANGARVLTAPSAAGVGTYAVEAIGVVDLMTPDSVRPKDSNFRSSGLSLFQLRLTFGQPGDIFVGGTTVFSGTAYVDVFVQQLVEVPDANGQVTTPIALKKVSFQELALTSSNANQEVRLPAGNFIRSVVVRTDGLTTAGEPSTGVLNNLQLAAGVDVRFNLTGPQLRAKNNADYGFVPAGYYAADVTSKANASINLTDLWDVQGAAEPKVILDVVGGASVKMQAIVTEYIMATA